MLKWGQEMCLAPSVPELLPGCSCWLCRAHLKGPAQSPDSGANGTSGKGNPGAGPVHQSVWLILHIHIPACTYMRSIYTYISMDTYVYLWIWIHIVTQCFIYFFFFKEEGGMGRKKDGNRKWERGRERENVWNKYTPLCLLWLSLGCRLMGNSFLPHLIRIF